MAKRIGFFVNAYDSKLSAGKHDVRRMHNVFTNERYGGCDITLTDPPHIDIPNKQKFHSTLNNFLKKIENTGDITRSQIIFYFSGHGKMMNSSYYLQFHEEELYSFTILLEELKTYGINKAIIILDTCFSGAATTQKSSDTTNINTKLPKGITILSSSSEYEYSHEKDDKTYSIFTDLLCECIETGNAKLATKDNFLYVDDIIEYVKNNNTHLDKQQNPKYQTVNADSKIWIAKNITLKEDYNTPHSLINKFDILKLIKRVKKQYIRDFNKIFINNEFLEIDHYYQDLDIVSSKKYTKKAFFSEVNNKNIKYLLNGIRGTGKTTFLKSMCLEWATNERVLSNYKIVLYIDLNDYYLEKPNKFDIFKLIKTSTQMNDLEIQELIDNYIEDILFIFDGLDKLNTNETYLFYTLHKKSIDNSLVVSRKDSIDILKMGVNKIFEFNGFKDQSIESLFPIVSNQDLILKTSQFARYIKKLFGQEKDTLQILWFLRKDKYAKMMFKNPLLLNIVRRNINKFHESYYQFYKSIIDELIYEEPNFFKIDNFEMDVLNPYKNINRYRKEQIDNLLSSIAFSSCREKQFQVLDPEEELDEELIKYILSLGLLETKVYCQTIKIDNFQFINPIFKKYFEAVYITKKMSEKQQIKYIKKISKIEENIDLLGFLYLLFQKKSKNIAILENVLLKYLDNLTYDIQLKTLLQINIPIYLDNPDIKIANYESFIDDDKHSNIEKSHLRNILSKIIKQKLIRNKLGQGFY